ncbi:unnamed protein product [marine sediment metagenome]|uniref:Uncharacterized protein n=1 Tax=marine sediment metagenome TaxID=412755 RepID=X0UZB9_9ZZZZ
MAFKWELVTGGCHYSARILEGMCREKKIRWSLIPFQAKRYGADLLGKVRRRQEQEALNYSFEKTMQNGRA